jgi:hypothetical protein
MLGEGILEHRPVDVWEFMRDSGADCELHQFQEIFEAGTKIPIEARDASKPAFRAQWAYSPVRKVELSEPA